MMEQRTEEWFKARCGKVTASRVADVVAKIRTGESASRANYRAQLVAERMTGVPAESYMSAAMQHGVDNEDTARAMYEVANSVMVEEVGLVVHKDIPMAGASPDGLVGSDGLIEIKCPNTATHIDYLMDGSVPSKYKAQMAWQCACTGRSWCDFVSYDPRMPEDHQLFVVRYTPEPDYIRELEREVVKFIFEVDAVISKLNERKK